MRSKLGTWSTGGKSADAGGSPIEKDKPKSLGKPFTSGKSALYKLSKAEKAARPGKPKPFSTASKMQRRKKGI